VPLSWSACFFFRVCINSKHAPGVRGLLQQHQQRWRARGERWQRAQPGISQGFEASVYLR